MRRNFIFSNVFQSTAWSQSYCRISIIDYSLEQRLDWYIDHIISYSHTITAQLTRSLTWLLPIINIKIKRKKEEEEENLTDSLNIDKITLTFFFNCQETCND